MPKKQSKIRLSTPWGVRPNFARANIAAQVCESDSDFEDHQFSPDKFVEHRSQIHSVYIQEKEKTFRMTIVVAAMLSAIALIVAVFAPPNREIIAWGAAFALMTTSAGVVGFSSFKLKSEVFGELEAGQSDNKGGNDDA